LHIVQDRNGTLWKYGREGRHSPPKNKVVQDLERNKDNRCPDPDFNKTKINYTKEPKEAHKNTLKEEILQVINENFVEMLLDMSTKMYKRHSRKAKTTKTKNMRKPRNK
jgi:hypothetical protein